MLELGSTSQDLRDRAHSRERGWPATGIAPVPAGVALGVSAIVGYLTIDALVRVVERVPFAIVCFALGALAIVGGDGIALVV
jgi:undecaprenyl pyrophosphate phosphatase UppP